MEIVLAGVTLGAIMVVEIAVWRGRTSRLVRLAALLFGLDVVLYALGSAGALNALIEGRPWLQAPLAAFVCGGVGYFSLLVRAGFNDRPVAWTAGLPVFALITIGMTALHTSGNVRLMCLALYVLVCFALLAEAVGVLLGGWPGDLIDVRRRLRRPGAALTVALVLAILLDVLLGMASRLGWLPSWLTGEREAGIALLAILVAAQALTLHYPRAAPQKSPEVDDTPVLHQIEAAMTIGEVWRQDSLTLADLVSLTHIPEYRLRRVIMVRLGHRNFPAFVNSYRIKAAMQQLVSAPDETIAQVAFNSGFNSLSAFNRAFREVTGETPTQWRRKKLTDSLNPRVA